MFYRISAALLVIAVAHQVSGEGCFSGGQVGDCSANIGTFCNSIGGSLIPNEQRSQCFNENGFKCDLTIKNVGNPGIPAVADCQSALESEASGCSTGGIKTLNGFQYTLDPNSGAC